MYWCLLFFPNYTNFINNILYVFNIEIIKLLKIKFHNQKGSYSTQNQLYTYLKYVFDSMLFKIREKSSFLWALENILTLQENWKVTHLLISKGKLHPRLGLTSVITCIFTNSMMNLSCFLTWKLLPKTILWLNGI